MNGKQIGVSTASLFKRMYNEQSVEFLNASGVGTAEVFLGTYRLFYLMTKNMTTCMTVAIILACVVGAITNTVTVLGAIDIIKMNGEWFSKVISTVIAVNGALEISLPPIITPIIVLGVRKGLRIRDKYNTHENDLDGLEGEDAL